MFLKRITICGFKSFCDRVDFDFGPGITCIVGPNGCGKSNLVDAFKWVLGEQSAKSLRGRQMTDMIFSGSATRRSSSVAQVDLVFDNTDRSLSMDVDEVTVSRKLYRSGDSGYSLNQSPARLKDVRELFMDTGVGVDAYSVVEQGRVDSLLKSNPVDRRIIFEEASGISKYKARRKEAQRKLERTGQNLLRVEDIIQELEKRLRSVKLQAGKARTYKEHQARLARLRSTFAMADYHRLTLAIEHLMGEKTRQQDRVTDLRTQISSHESEEARLQSELDRVNEEITAADSRFVQAKSELLALEERVEAARIRAHEQGSLAERTQQRISTDNDRLDTGQKELEQVESAAEILQRQTQKLHAQIDQLTEKDRQGARNLTEAQAVLEDEKAGIIELLRKSAQLHNEIIRLNTHRESLVTHKGRLSERTTRISAELEPCIEEKVELEQRLVKIDELIEAESRKLEEKKVETINVDADRQRLVDELATAREQRSAMQSRRDVLEQLQARMEGIGKATRIFLERQLDNSVDQSVTGTMGLVADAFDVDVVHAKLIEAALGDWAQAVVAPSSQIFDKCPALFDDLPGRLSLLCVDRIPPIISNRDFSQEPGFVASAMDLVRVPEEFDILPRHLLGRTIIVETLDDAFRMASSDVTGYRFVTQHCEVVEPDGRVHTGPPSTTDGLISRRSELRNIATQMATLEEFIARLSDQLNRTSAMVSHLEEVQQALRTSIYEANTTKVEAHATLQSRIETIRRLTQEQPLIAHEATLLEQQIKDVLERADAEGKSREAVERDNQVREQNVSAHQERIDRIVDERRSQQAALTQVKVELGEVAARRSAATDAIHNLQRTICDLETAITGSNRELTECRTRIAEARATVDSGDSDRTRCVETLEHLEKQCAQVRRTREELRQRVEHLVGTIKDARVQLEQTESHLHEVDLELAQSQQRRDDLATRVAGELGTDLAVAYESYEHVDNDWEQVESEIAEIRKKMDRLGNVNLNAIDELAELEERHGFLTTQRDDLDRSRRQLEQLIERLNDESRERFLTTFAVIRDNFRALFRKLFGGGRADIVLEDTENVLECGIEILAQPPGKELQSITLMSGGEKSMTAIALLMSIFKTHPAPFAILDEVDAALDEANNDRFNRVILDFVNQSQFLVITHSKWTMNMADQLYGITMQEPGVSTRVSVEFKGANVA